MLPPFYIMEGVTIFKDKRDNHKKMIVSAKKYDVWV